MNTLSVRELSVRYPGADRPAVSAVSFGVSRGETLALVGESGSGKSTIALAIARLLNPSVAVSAAELDFEGRDLLSMNRRELRRLRGAGIAMIFQSQAGSWNPTRTLGVQLRDGLRASGIWPEGRVRLLDLLRRVGIDRPEDRLEDYPHQLSGGMLQRVMIAGALVARPSLLIADEPTSALDTTVQAEILDVLDEMRAEYDLALVLISHDMGVVARVASRTIVLYGGYAVEAAATRDLYRAAHHPYTTGLLTSIPTATGPRKADLPTLRPGPVSARGCGFSTRCPNVVERCRTEVPAVRPVGRTEVACHRAEEIP